jgi:O-antigen ligase
LASSKLLAPARVVDEGVASALSGIPWIEKLFASGVLLLSMWAVVPLLRLESRQSELDNYVVEGDPVAQAIWTVIYVIGLVLILRRSWRVLESALHDRALVLLHVLVVLSLAWSDNPEVSMKRAAALLGTSLLGLYFATRYTRSDLVRLLVWACGAAVALSVLTAVVAPQLAWDATSTPEEGLRGIFSQKNVLGRVMALSVVVWLLYAGDYRRHRWFALACAAISLGLLVLSNSKSALLVCLTLLLLLGLAVVTRIRNSGALTILSVLVLAMGGAAIGLIGSPDVALDALGRNVTLSGRTDLWQLVVAQIQERPWLGYGYGGFWMGWDGPSRQIWAATDWFPPSSHNGFLDAMLDVGAVGLVLLLASLIGSARRALALIIKQDTFVSLFPMIFISYFVLSNITETAALTYNTILWMLLVTLAIQLRGGEIGCVGKVAMKRPISRSNIRGPRL